MGGGDLNLKKSWHPSTFHNLEKVWKLEHKNEAERKKIEQLQQEIREERSREDIQRIAEDAGVVKKKDDRVDWMYAGVAGHVDREEYLLGKRIDRQIDPLLASEEREKEALASGPGALFTSPDMANSAVDMAIKVREDPLFLIRKKEEEAKKQLTSNPVKLKRLQELLAKEREEHTHRKSKKKKKSRGRSRSPHRKSHTRKKRKRSQSPVPESLSPPPPPPHHRHKHSSISSSSSCPHPPPPPPPSLPPPVKRSTYTLPSSARAHNSRMSQEERERRRKEMMVDAKVHDHDREQRLKRHREEQRREEEDSKTSHSSDFLQPMRVQSMSAAGSVQERIQRNIRSVQRTPLALDAHFLRK